MQDQAIALAFSLLASLVSDKFTIDGTKDFMNTKSCFNCFPLSNGQTIPVVGFGTGSLGSQDQVIQSIKDAITSGYRLIDTAYKYGNEKAIGIALKELFDAGIVKREELFITTKIWSNYHSEELALKSVRKSLADLQLNYVDLVLIHWPMSFQSGGEDKPFAANGSIIEADLSKENFELAYKGLEKAVDLGLTKSIGVSNFNIKQLEKIIFISRIAPVVNQVESHPFLNQKELLRYCIKNGIRLEAYSPLQKASSALFQNETLKNIAEKHGKTVAQVVLRWQIQRGVVVIPKSSKLNRIRENRDLFNFSLEKGEMEQINALNRNERIGKFPGSEHMEEYPF